MKHFFRILCVGLVVTCIAATSSAEVRDVTCQYLQNADMEQGVKSWVSEGDRPLIWNTKNPNTRVGFHGMRQGVLEAWNSNANLPLGNSRTMQRIGGLPNGTYVFGAYVGATRQNAREKVSDNEYKYWSNREEIHGVSLFANGDEAPVATDNPDLGGLCQKWAHSSKFNVATTVTDSTLEVGLRVEGTNANYVVWDNVTLYYFGDMSEADALDAMAEIDMAKATEIADSLLCVKMNVDTLHSLRNAIEEVWSHTVTAATLWDDNENIFWHIGLARKSATDYENLKKDIEAAKQVASKDINEWTQDWTPDYVNILWDVIVVSVCEYDMAGMNRAELTALRKELNWAVGDVIVDSLYWAWSELEKYIFQAYEKIDQPGGITQAQLDELNALSYEIADTIAAYEDELDLSIEEKTIDPNGLLPYIGKINNAIQEEESTAGYVIALTAEVDGTERTFEFGSAIEGENKISIDWGDGNIVEGATIAAVYDGWTTTSVTGTPKGSGEIKIYATGDVCYFDCVSKIDGPGITTLDVSKAVALTELYANGNKLSSFDASMLDKLSKVCLNNNSLTEVNFPASLTYLNISNNKLTSWDGGSLVSLTTLYLSNNTSLGTLDVSNMPALKSLYALNCGLTSFNAGALKTAKAYISLNNNLLETLDVSEATGLENGSLFAMGNNLTEIKLPNVKVKAVNISKNKFTLATIPATANVTTLTYAPQQDMVIGDIEKTIDLSAQNNLTGFATEAQPTVYAWYAEDGTALVAGTDYTEEAGVFTFTKEQTQKVYCTMTTEALPKFTGRNEFKTVAVAVLLKPEPIPDMTSVYLQNADMEQGVKCWVSEGDRPLIWNTKNPNRQVGFHGMSQGVLEAWNGNANLPLGNSCTMQQIDNLPNGTYVFGAYVGATRQNAREKVGNEYRYWSNRDEIHGVYLFANGDEVTVATDNPDFGASYQKWAHSSKFNVATTVFNDTLQVGLRVEGTNANYVVWDNATLYYFGDMSEAEALDAMAEIDMAKAAEIADTMLYVKMNVDTLHSLRNAIYEVRDHTTTAATLWDDSENIYWHIGLARKSATDYENLKKDIEAAKQVASKDINEWTQDWTPDYVNILWDVIVVSVCEYDMAGMNRAELTALRKELNWAVGDVIVDSLYWAWSELEKYIFQAVEKIDQPGGITQAQLDELMSLSNEVADTIGAYEIDLDLPIGKRTVNPNNLLPYIGKIKNAIQHEETIPIEYTKMPIYLNRAVNGWIEGAEWFDESRKIMGYTSPLYRFQNKIERFRITVKSNKNNGPFFVLSELGFYDADGVKIELEASAITSNADHNTLNPGIHDGGGIDALIDNDYDSYFHSAWENAPSEAHYLEVTLPNGGYEAFSFRMLSRSNINGWDQTHFFPSEMVISTPANGLQVYDSCSMKVQDVEGKASNFVSIPVEMENSGELTAFQFDLYLPTDVSAVYSVEDGDILYDMTFNNERVKGSHVLAADHQADGSLRIVGYSINNEAFVGNSGVLVNVKVAVGDLDDGDYEIALRNIRLVAADGAEQLCADYTSTLTIKNSLPGDVNGDYRYTMSDVVMMVNAVLGKTQTNFDYSVADMNEDGVISMGDVVSVLRLVLTDGAVKAPAHRTSYREVTVPRLDIYEACVIGRGCVTLPVALNNSETYSAFQMDVVLPEGVELVEAALTGRAKASHTIAWNALDDGRVRVVAYAMDNAAFKGNEGALINLVLNIPDEQSPDAEIRLTEGLFATVSGIEHRAPEVSIKMRNETTDVNEATTAQFRTYGVENAVVVECASDTPVSIYSVTGQLVQYIVAKAGRNVVTLSTGVYVVNGDKVIVK